MSDQTVLYLHRGDLESLNLGVPDIIELLRHAFSEHAAGRATMPGKCWIVRSADSFFCAMPCYIPALGAAGCKWNSGNPGAPARGLPYVQGLYILSDAETGAPLAIMNSAWITAARTGAATGLAARALAREGASTVAILGCGVQGRSNLEALRLAVPTVAAVRAYDVSPEAADRLVADASTRLGLDARRAADPREAVIGADIIITAGPNIRGPHPIELEWLAPGALGVSVNRDSFWAPGAVSAMDTIVADDVQQIDDMKRDGFFTAVREVSAELGHVVAGRAPGRRRADDRILVFNLGVALEDLATAVELYRRAQARGIGTVLAV